MQASFLMLKGLAKEPDPEHNQLQIKVAQK
jgi:hypothetical protein